MKSNSERRGCSVTTDLGMCLLWPATFLVAFYCSVAVASDYYVSPGGKDTDPGTLAKPWKSISKINSTTFSAGDRIFFEGGQTFAGTVSLSSTDSGTAASPVVFTSYGSGRATIDAGAGDGVGMYNGGGITISNLSVTGTNTTKNGIGFYTDSAGGVKYPRVVVADTDVHGFKNGVSFGSWEFDYPGWHDVRIERVNAYNNSGAGISLWDMAGSVVTNYAITNLYIGHCNSYSNGGSGIIVGGVSSGLVEFCRTYGNLTCGGIWTYSAKDVFIQHCVSYNNKRGTSDGFGYDLDGGSDGCVIQYCVSYSNETCGYMVCDYPDARKTRNNVIRYSLSENDGRYSSADQSSFHFVTWGSGIDASHVYNCVAYLTSRGGTKYLSGLRAFRCNYDNREYLRGCSFRNNIVFLDGIGYYLRLIQCDSAGDDPSEVVWQGNCYYAANGAPCKYSVGSTDYTSLSAWRTAKGQEKVTGTNVGFETDPRFVQTGAVHGIDDPTTMATTIVYRLQGTSPLIDRGLNLATLFGINAGAQDFYGNTIPQCRTYDVGAYESPDSDHDFVADDWEKAHFGGLGVAGATSDHDGDGMSDRDEFVAGTDPTNNLSCFAITNVMIQGVTNVILRWPSTEGRFYGIRTDTNLVESGDVVITNGITATPPTNVYTCRVDNAPVRFYAAFIQESW